MRKIIIAGGRDFTDYNLLKEEVRKFMERESIEHPEIVSGKASGADSLGERFAKEFSYGIREFPANWKTYGKAAGHVRNEQMAKYGDACIVFWDGQSRGTRNMISLAKEYGLPLEVVFYKKG